MVPGAWPAHAPGLVDWLCPRTATEPVTTPGEPTPPAPSASASSSSEPASAPAGVLREMEDMVVTSPSLRCER